MVLFFSVILSLPDAVTLSVPDVIVTSPTLKLLLLLIHNCNFATVRHCNDIVCITPVKGSCDPEGVATHRWRTADFRLVICIYKFCPQPLVFFLFLLSSMLKRWVHLLVVPNSVSSFVTN